MKRSVYLVFAAIFPLMVCSGIIYSVFALCILELGATEAVIGFIFATGSATAAFTGPLLGRLSDMFGRKRVLMFSMGIFVIVFLLHSLAESFLDIAIIQGL